MSIKLSGEQIKESEARIKKSDPAGYAMIKMGKSFEGCLEKAALIAFALTLVLVVASGIAEAVGFYPCWQIAPDLFFLCQR